MTLTAVSHGLGAVSRGLGAVSRGLIVVKGCNDILEIVK